MGLGLPLFKSTMLWIPTEGPYSITHPEGEGILEPAPSTTKGALLVTGPARKKRPNAPATELYHCKTTAPM